MKPEKNIKISAEVARRKGKVYLYLSGTDPEGIHLTLQRSTDQVRFVTVNTRLFSHDDAVRIVTDEYPLNEDCVYRVRWTSAEGIEQHVDKACQGSITHEKVEILERAGGQNIQICLQDKTSDKNFLMAIYDDCGREIISLTQQLSRAGAQILNYELPFKLRAGLYNIITSFTTTIHCQPVLIP